MTALAAAAVGCRTEQFLVASTGVIGRPLPMPVLEAGIPAAAKRLASSVPAVNDAAHAILTTDTRIKVASARLEFSGSEARLLGFAKGAAMIGPNMATMLAFLMSDATVRPEDLQTILKHSVSRTFNCISVEGHMSTNDSVFLFANGHGTPLGGKDLDEFAAGVQTICAYLAKEIARDAEGAAHLVTIEIEGTRDDDEAIRIAKTIAESALVKCAIFGADPNWGRMVSAAGYAGIPFEEKQLSLWLGDMLLYQHGVPLPFDPKTASNYLRHNRDVTLRLRFTLGNGQCTFYTCDLTPEYIRLNADYTT
jgi:glutamate N-acetyltransferase/amino-acid N-acetyltransferase